MSSSVELSTSPTPSITTSTTTTSSNNNNTNNNTTTTANGVYNFHGNQNIKIQHYFNYSTIMRDREACSSFLDYLTNVTHCDENLLFLLHLDNIKFMKTVPSMMEQTQVVIDTYVKLESSKELNITEKIRTSVIQQYEELKSLFPNGDFKSNQNELTQEFIQGKIQQIFNELVVQINLQLKQDSFESYLSSEVFEKFIIKKIRDKMQHQQEKEKHQEKQKKKRASSLFPASPNTFDIDNYSFRDSDAADGYIYEDADSSSGLGANLMKRFVGGLLKGGAALQQAVNNHTSSSASGSFDEVSPSNSLTNSTDNLSCNSAITTSTTSSSNTCLDADDQQVGNFHIKHHRIKSLSNQQPQENSNDTVEIMKNIIQDLYKQLIQKDQEIKKLHEAIKQHNQLMGLGGERKSKPLPTAPMSPQPGSHSHHSNNPSLLSEQLTSPRKVPKPLPSTLNRMSLNAEQSKEIKNMNFNSTNSSVATPSHEHSKSLHQLYSTPSSTNNSNGKSVQTPTKNLTLSTSSATPQYSSTAVKKDTSTATSASTNSKEETGGSPLIRRQTTQTLIVGNKKLDTSDSNTPSSPKTKKVLDISSSSENLKDDSKLPITQRLQFFEKLNAASSPTSSPPKDSAIKRYSQTVSNK